MEQSIKNKILYSNDITSLITNEKAECIFLGGSNSEGLESPESDYNIIVILNDLSLPIVHTNNLFEKRRWIKINRPVQVVIYNLHDILNMIKNSAPLYNYFSYEQLKSLLFLKEENILYSTERFKNFLVKFQNYKKPLGCLCLEGSLHSAKKLLLNDLLTEYSKNIYYFYKALHYWNNFKSKEEFLLNPRQKKMLIDLKTTKQVPKTIYIVIKSIHPYSIHTNPYDYDAIREELITTWEKEYS
jgi:predicted nucleotidyltransferase